MALNHDAISKHPPQAAAQGMWAIQRVHLPAGQRIYRFGSTAAPDLWYAGAWWMRYEDLTKIRAFAERSGVSLGYAARRLLAVKYEWGNANVLLSALVAAPLDAYAGRGRVQVDDRAAAGGAYDWHPPTDVMQLFIPGLADASRRRSAVSRQALVDGRHEFIRSEAFR